MNTRDYTILQKEMFPEFMSRMNKRKTLFKRVVNLFKRPDNSPFPIVLKFNKIEKGACVVALIDVKVDDEKFAETGDMLLDYEVLAFPRPPTDNDTKKIEDSLSSFVIGAVTKFIDNQEAKNSK